MVSPEVEPSPSSMRKSNSFFSLGMGGGLTSFFVTGGGSGVASLVGTAGGVASFFGSVFSFLFLNSAMASLSTSTIRFASSLASTCVYPVASNFVFSKNASLMAVFSCFAKCCTSSNESISNGIPDVLEN